MPGRIEVYIHSDNSTPNKGGALVRIECQTDFAARTGEFIAFSKGVAILAYGSLASSWDDLISEYPHMLEEKSSLSKTLKEEIDVTDIQLLFV